MRGMKLSVKLPLLIVLSVLVSALAIFALSAYLTRNSLRAIEMEANSRSVHAYASAASSYLEEARSALEIAAALPQITGFASGGPVDPALHGVPADAALLQRDVVASILKNSRVFECMMLLKADGTIYLLEPYELQVKALRGNLAFRSWYLTLMSGGETVISDLLISNATQPSNRLLPLPHQCATRRGRSSEYWLVSLNWRHSRKWLATSWQPAHSSDMDMSPTVEGW